jgi:hypothetical protein
MQLTVARGRQVSYTVRERGVIAATAGVGAYT